jgi:hypothetical protein
MTAGWAHWSPCPLTHPSPVHARERCSAQQRQQQLEGEIKVALQLLQRAGAHLPDRAAIECPLAASITSRFSSSGLPISTTMQPRKPQASSALSGWMTPRLASVTALLQKKSSQCCRLTWAREGSPEVHPPGAWPAVTFFPGTPPHTPCPGGRGAAPCRADRRCGCGCIPTWGARAAAVPRPWASRRQTRRRGA